MAVDRRKSRVPQHGYKRHVAEICFGQDEEVLLQVFQNLIIRGNPTVFCGSAGNKFLFSNENKLVNIWFPGAMEKIFPLSSNSDSRMETAETYRLLIQGFLKPEALQTYIGIMDSLARSHLETHWDNKKQVKVRLLVKDCTFSLAWKLFLSLEDPNQLEEMASYIAGIASGLFSTPVDLPGTKLNRAVKASSLLRNKVFEIVKERKIDLAEDKALPIQDILLQMLRSINKPM